MDETNRIKVLLELGLDSSEPFVVGNQPVVPRDFIAWFIGRKGIPDGLITSNVKRVVVEGRTGGKFDRITYDFAVDAADGSASSHITGTVAAVATDLVARGGQAGVHSPEGASVPGAVLQELYRRGFQITETREIRRLLG